MNIFVQFVLFFFVFLKSAPMKMETPTRMCRQSNVPLFGLGNVNGTIRNLFV